MDLKPKHLIRKVVDRARAQWARRASAVPSPPSGTPIPPAAGDVPDAALEPSRTVLECRRDAGNAVWASWELDAATRTLAAEGLSALASISVRCVAFHVGEDGLPRRTLLQQVGLQSRGEQAWSVPPGARCVIALGVSDGSVFQSVAHRRIRLDGAEFDLS